MTSEENQGHETEVEALIRRLIETELRWPFEDTVIEFQENGLTNSNYIVAHGERRGAIRISGSHTDQLGINRYAEEAALRALDGLSIAPELLYFDPVRGHMITRFVEGRQVEQPELARRAEEVAALFKLYHSLPPVEYEFSPYRDIENRIGIARSRNLPLPDSLDKLLDKLASIKTSREQAGERFRGMCHNDPFPNNFLDDGSLRLLDWEYAGMGDVMFDLACLAWGYRREDRDRLLACYFGDEEGPRQRGALEDVIYVVQFWNAMWATLQIGTSHPTFNYAEMAGQMFGGMEQQL
ncbi:choline/ethanolamine kinase family protein [Paenibacillus harenae]|uniref:Thiamine kinase-like enzyme n=1 Tax=Paenibacillus harenae TaxID=306543 RepID=A0ABT9U337_PAEHA|nr:choline/ethanolamine kinase family protein [Paenibacillus harenae]MDQ0114051.1 thiamine kinase-like enzyme [Paenibacillus harenae]